MTKLVARQRHTAFGLSVRQLDVAIVDDDTLMLKFASAVLERMGVARVRVFTNPIQAFKAMADDPPNLVMVDWMMKPVDGCVLLRRMRLVSSAPLCFVPAIMASARATKAFVDKALVAGAHQIIAKPMLEQSIVVRAHSIIDDGRVFILSDDRYIIDGALPTAADLRMGPADEFFERETTRWAI